MGRKKQRTHEDSPATSGLESPWPSSPASPPKYVLYCYNHATDRRYIVPARALYAARKLYDALTDGQSVEVSPLRADTRVFGEVDIRSEQMDEILAYQYTQAAAEWRLEQPYINQIHQFLNGPQLYKTRLDAPDVLPLGPSSSPVKKVDRTGKTSIQDLCKEVGVDPRDARAALRKAKMQKPLGGWLFAADQIDSITKIIKGAK